MVKRRNLDRERLEMYLMNVLLAYRPIFLVGGLVLFIYGISALPLSLRAGGVALGMAIFLVLLTASFHATLYIAKMGAWIGTIWRK